MVSVFNSYIHSKIKIINGAHGFTKTFKPKAKNLHNYDILKSTCLLSTSVAVTGNSSKW